MRSNLVLIRLSPSVLPYYQRGANCRSVSSFPVLRRIFPRATAPFDSPTSESQSRLLDNIRVSLGVIHPQSPRSRYLFFMDDSELSPCTHLSGDSEVKSE